MYVKALTAARIIKAVFFSYFLRYLLEPANTVDQYKLIYLPVI